MKLHFGIYAIDKTMEYIIWFVFGMLLAFGAIRLCNLRISILLFVVFIVGSVLDYCGIIRIFQAATILGAIACYSIISFVWNVDSKISSGKVLSIFRKYTMPIF